MHVYNADKFNDYSEAEGSLGIGEESADVASDLDFTFDDPK